MATASALFYLRSRSLQNVLRSRLSRLRQPKYLLGAMVGCAYLYFVFFRSRPRGPVGNRSSLVDAAAPEFVASITLIFAVGLLVVFLLCWVWPRARAALNFSEAEIAFLFPAPVTRSALVHFRLVNLMLRVLFTALVLAVVSRNWNSIRGDFVIRFLGWWLIFAGLSLHIVGSSFTITRWQDRGFTTARRILFTLILIGCCIGALTTWLERHPPIAAGPVLAGLAGFAAYLQTVTANGPLYWLLLPTRLIVEPLLSADLRSFLVALGPALLMLALHYAWVLQSQVGFEEASVAKAERRAATLAAWRQGKTRSARSAPKARSAPFDLAVARRPEFAFLWKNLLATASYLRLRTAVVAALLVVVASSWIARHPEYHPLRQFLLGVSMLGGIVVLSLGAQLARQDLRGDMSNLDILKIYPLHGWQVVLGQILTPVIILTTVLWLCVLTAGLLLEAPRWQWLTPQARATAAVVIACLAPLLCTLQVLIVNAAVMIFPAWTQTNQDRSNQGIDILGQRILFLAAQLLTVALTLLPALLAAGAVFFAFQWLSVILGAILALIAAMVVLGAEAAMAITWLGRRFERFDLSAELRP